MQQDLEKFDAVCMATALHTLASMRASGQQYAAVFERPELLQLMHVIGECPLAPFTSVLQLIMFSNAALYFCFICV